VVKPKAKKIMVQFLIEKYSISERKACVIIGISRTGFRHVSIKKELEI